MVEFLSEGLTSGSPGIVIATPNQRTEIIRELTERSFEVVALQRSHSLVFLDAEDTLSTFMIDGKANAQEFRDQICQVIEKRRCGRPDSRVRVFGQRVDVLWEKGERDAAIGLELLWNQLAQSEASSVVCGYAIGNFLQGRQFRGNLRARIRVVKWTANRIVATPADSTRRRPERTMTGDVASHEQLLDAAQLLRRRRMCTYLRHGREGCPVGSGP